MIVRFPLWNRDFPQTKGSYKRATMDRTAWTQPTGIQSAFRRAGGRRRYNAARRQLADRPLIPLARRIAARGELEDTLDGHRMPLPRSLIPELARVLGVHRSTVWRDLQRLRRQNYCWEYSRVTGMVTVRLYGIAKFTYRRDHSCTDGTILDGAKNDYIWCGPPENRPSNRKIGERDRESW